MTAQEKDTPAGIDVARLEKLFLPLA